MQNEISAFNSALNIGLEIENHKLNAHSHPHRALRTLAHWSACAYANRKSSSIRFAAFRFCKFELKLIDSEIFLYYIFIHERATPENSGTNGE